MDSKVIDRVAHLARLKINEGEGENFSKSLTRILDFVSQLEEVETNNIPPLVNVAAHKMSIRLDEITDGNCAENVLKNAPQKGQGMFIVPKVVE